MTITPFTIAVPDADLADLRDRLARVRWPEAETVYDWSQGVPLAYLQELCEHWRTAYDWRIVEAKLNALGQHRADVDGLGIHLIHQRSPHDDALPLVMTHGWPGSVVEFLKVIGPLTDPTAHGGSTDDAFHVVCPSLPGYGWSDKPTDTGWGVERIAAAWTSLMGELGYDRFGAQGGDWGSAVTSAIGANHAEHVAGIHLNMAITLPSSMEDLTEAEQSALEGMQHYQRWDSGYSKQQSTRPQTLGYGLADSPAGQCAWILEKLWAWTDCDGHPEKALSHDEMLDDITLYWLTNSAASSGRLYWESFDSGFGPTEISVPTGISVFPKEIFRTSERWARSRFSDLRHFNTLERGGHFAAWEQPETFVDEVRTFFRTVR